MNNTLYIKISQKMYLSFLIEQISVPQKFDPEGVN